MSVLKTKGIQFIQFLNKEKCTLSDMGRDQRMDGPTDQPT
jgi:hypothetical protein